MATWLASFPDFLHFRHYSVIWKQLLFANNRNRVRWIVLGLSQDGACTDLFEYFSEDSLKGDLSNDTILPSSNPPLFSLVNTFKRPSKKWIKSLLSMPHFEGTWHRFNKNLLRVLQYLEWQFKSHDTQPWKVLIKKLRNDKISHIIKIHW